MKKINIKREIKEFAADETGMGVVEIVLIIIVLIGLVIIFKKQITSLVNSILGKMTSQANQIKGRTECLVNNMGYGGTCLIIRKIEIKI